MNSSKEKRATVKLKCANPLFEEWLLTWRDQAAAKESKMQYSFNLALKSLRKYPLPFESGRECKILKGFGDRLCKMLDDKLKAHKKYNGDISDNNAANILPTATQTTAENKRPRNLSKTTPNKTHSRKEYIPQYGSGAYAILVALYKQSLEHNYPGFLKKDDIINYGKDLLINASFTKPEPGSRYTAWSSMKTLLTKNLVSKASHPPKFSLTDEGIILAKKIYENSNSVSSINDNNVPVKDTIFAKTNILDNNISQCYGIIDIPDEFIDDAWVGVDNDTFSQQINYAHTNLNSEKVVETNDVSFKRYASDPIIPQAKNLAPSKVPLKRYASSSSVTSTKSSCSSYEQFSMAPYSFDIILYVDNNETSGSSNSQEDEILVELRKSTIKFEVKSLKVGDFTWICRDRLTGKELVLPYIIERKRMDDFAHSIRDKRYYEQKFRLKKSGIENLTYLVESHGKNQHSLGLPLQSLYQAATNTAIQENFFIKFTENMKETVEYLVHFTKILVEMFKSKSLGSCYKEDIQPVDINTNSIHLMAFKEFNESSVKNKRMKVTDLFVKMLIQIKGMSVERALAITQKYPTPIMLKMAYNENIGSLGEKLLSGIKYGSSNKSIGAVLSKTVYQAFTKLQY
ncbi:unnamed protein product [Ceutorhynchus assimilis]|uniref:Crossover junction endonuclease MUS81 n=1 Tax=Ceutorhynchus assimilis TaxID=467358 RepID=A0A9N9QQ43_9CUCU|nr:unnamed protein product [Ceutorhynchus assimilis]